MGTAHAELSRRVALCMHTFIIQKLTQKERNKFIDDVEKSDSFDLLSENSKNLIIRAERESAKELERYNTPFEKD